MAAAVSDFRPRHVADKKLDRSHGLKLELEATPDLLAETAERVKVAAGASGRRPVLVGFAAEVGGLDRAPEKLRSKGVDMLVANDVTEEGSGFGTDTNKVTIYATDAQPEQLPMLSKREVAELLLDRVVIRLGGAVRPESDKGAGKTPKTEKPEPVEAGR
jgi:phosphopantothenoylcysteine decarboxylase/phosphopantothenate--cysteine ligase